MPRMYSKTTLLAVAMLTGVCLALLGTARVVAQDTPVACPPGAVCPHHGAGCPHGAGCLGGGALGSYLGALHGNDITNCRPRTYGQPDLFYNYYVPGTCGGVPAAAYIAPVPVPALVGHTYFTYQPFLPNELLYPHHRTYYRYYDQGRGLTRTSVSWYRPPIYIPSHFRIAR
ncbi:MAG: hypothetical protein ACYC6N_05940 [Pirellulaceae bacterium]